MKVSVIIITLDQKYKSPDILNYPGIIEILISRWTGRSKARNKAALRAKGTFLLFLDDDVYLSREIYLRYIFESFKKNPENIVCAEHTILGTRVLGIRKDLFFMLNGFDESFNIGEDADFGFKALKNGLVINKIPHKNIPHREHARLGVYLNLLEASRNRARYMLRYKKCWYQDVVEPLSLKGFLKTSILIRKNPLAIAVTIVSTLFSTFYYAVRDRQ